MKLQLRNTVGFDKILLNKNLPLTKKMSFDIINSAFNATLFERLFSC